MILMFSEGRVLVHMLVRVTMSHIFLRLWSLLFFLSVWFLACIISIGVSKGHWFFLLLTQIYCWKSQGILPLSYCTFHRQYFYFVLYFIISISLLIFPIWRDIVIKSFLNSLSMACFSSPRIFIIAAVKYLSTKSNIWARSKQFVLAAFYLCMGHTSVSLSQIVFVEIWTFQIVYCSNSVY